MTERGTAWTLLLASLVAPPAAADAVHLANGRTLEGVVAREADGTVRIHLEFGEIALPAHLVLRIEKEASALAEFEARWAELALRADASGEEWLELARWARAAGLDHGAGQAALRAAEFAPESGPAGALLASLGFLRDEGSGQWLRYEEAMVRSGRVLYAGTWVAAAELAAREAAEARARQESLSADREDRLTRAVELLVLAQVAETTAERSSGMGIPLYAYPFVVSSVFVPVKPHHAPLPWARGQAGVLDDLLRRNPGSLLPVGEPGRVTRSRFSSPAMPTPTGSASGSSSEP